MRRKTKRKVITVVVLNSLIIIGLFSFQALTITKDVKELQDLTNQNILNMDSFLVTKTTDTTTISSIEDEQNPASDTENMKIKASAAQNVFFGGQVDVEYNQFYIRVIQNIVILVIFSAILVTIAIFRILQIYRRESNYLLHEIDLGEVENSYDLKEAKALQNRINLQRKESLDLVSKIQNINKYITHEQKNSLAILKGKVLFEDKNEIVKYIDKINLQIDDINSLTSVENERELVKIDLLMLVAELVDYYSHFEIDFFFSDEEDEFTIYSRKVWMERAISNIIENAFNYGATKVWINLEKYADNIILQIANNGNKIEQTKIPLIFNVNFRLNNLKDNGRGIGLALVKNVVDLSHGSIFCESTEQLTSFIMSFPDSEVNDEI
ncbi:MAG: sensor histidine kinase [Mycoplasmatales bacterium]